MSNLYLIYFRLTKSGTKIATASDRPKLKWHFTLIDSSVPNAFATQGGYVYITRGMLALLQSDVELAAVLAHEIAHICSRDSLRAQRVGNMMGLGVYPVPPLRSSATGGF